MPDTGQLPGDVPWVAFGPEVTSDLSIAESREWLVTNGRGSYASGTVAGSISRGYHGLLVAAVHPPTDRRIVLVALQERLTVDTGRGVRAFDLATNRWGGDVIAPEGLHHIEHFELRGSVPTWRYRCADALIEKSIWMEHGADTTYVAYTVLSAAAPIGLEVAAIVDQRPFHNTGQTTAPSGVEHITDGVRIHWDDADAVALTIRASAPAEVVTAADVDRGFVLRRETERGLRDTDDHVHAATLSTTLAVGETVVLMATTSADAVLDGDARRRRTDRDAWLLHQFRQARPAARPAPAWIEQLVLAADQFVVARPTPEHPDGTTVIAGYHWFGDWGRDTMISLPGLALTTGRSDLAAPILTTFARAVSEGMLPNRFPDQGDVPEYNTIDATLWYVHAIGAHHEATGDTALLATLFPVLEDIVEHHVGGTRYGIGVDPADGLLRWDADGVQLTWMDARVGDHVITPRRGKPVEVNALWYHALRTVSSIATTLGRDASRFDHLADAAQRGFDRFWNDEAGCCFDVIDGPDGDDAALRPNQILAVSLPHSALSAERQRAVVETVGRTLLTSHGLATLASDDPAYVGRYAGDAAHRDGSYHQGTVWAWLIGAYVDAVLRVDSDTCAAARALAPFADHLRTAGLGTISEIFDGDPPHAPRGCIAQAWSVAEVLRAFDRIDRRASIEPAPAPTRPATTPEEPR